MSLLNKCLNFTLRNLLPDYCRVCRRRSDTSYALCGDCLRQLPRIKDPCPRCTLPDTGGRLCGRCQARRPAYDASVAAFSYAEPVSSLICTLKYAGDTTAARLLGQLLAEKVIASGRALPDVIVPVPLHPRRIIRRGFNQSIEISKVAARQLNIPVAAAAVRRIKHTPAQQTLPLAERRGNVRGCFDVIHPPDARRIALVDDVMTSGATLDALANAFKHRGAYEVHAWVCARA